MRSMQAPFRQAGRHSLGQAPAPGGGAPVQKVVQQVRHKHAKAHRVNQAQSVHTLAMVARQHASNEGACTEARVPAADR